MTTSLASVRDLILPGVWAINGKGGPEIDISIDFSHDCIMIFAAGVGSEVLLTRQEIKDQSYVVDLAPKIERFKVKASVKYISYGTTEGVVSGSVEPERK